MTLENELEQARNWPCAIPDRTTEGSPSSLREEETGLVEAIRHTDMSELAKLSRIYDLSDRLHRRLQDRFPSRGACSGCCYADIAVCDIEIQYIQSVFEVDRKVYLSSSFGQNAGRPCIFLRDGRCAIHEARPYVCRPRLSQVEMGRRCDGDCRLRSDKVIYADLEKSFNLLRRQSGSFDIFDIRDVFV